MSEPKLCCNCLHCARWKKSTGVECHCDLNDKYLGYLQVMDENDCDKWEKETKWDLEREHDKKIRADALDEFARAYEQVELFGCTSCKHLDDDVHCWKCIAEQLKEKKNDI